jgi:hypothetical protein
LFRHNKKTATFLFVIVVNGKEHAISCFGCLQSMNDVPKNGKSPFARSMTLAGKAISSWNLIFPLLVLGNKGESRSATPFSLCAGFHLTVGLGRDSDVTL